MSEIPNWNLRLPVIASPLFIVSQPELVIAQCKAGVVGSFPALNARPQAQLDEWLHQISEELDAWNRCNPKSPAAPFAVNHIVHRTNKRLENDLEVAIQRKAPIAITSLGAREDVTNAVHASGGIVFHDVINISFPRKAVERGADGLIAVAAGADGHAGNFAFVQELRTWFDGPIALAGAIARGSSILAVRDARRFCLYRVTVYRHARGDGYGSIQKGNRGRPCGRHCQHEPIYRRARQLLARRHQGWRARPRQLADIGSFADELGIGREHGCQGMARHLGLRSR